MKHSISRLLLTALFIAASFGGSAAARADETAADETAAGEKGSVEITVAAAADLSLSLKEIAANYQKQTGVQVKLSFAASGALTQQIQNGAPFDLFFSADMDYPRQLIASGDADGATLYRYAVGTLVLWAPTDSPLDPEHQEIKTLLAPSVKKIAIANPEHAPYGRAAVATLKHFGIYEQVQDRLVIGENVSQAAQYVESGNAQVGFIALAHAAPLAMRGEGKFWKVPAEAHPPLDQGVVVITRSQHKREAAAFVDYVKTKAAADILRRYGFSVPQENAPQEKVLQEKEK
jgi:molybdate transport system substrate-binding protein